MAGVARAIVGAATATGGCEAVGAASAGAGTAAGDGRGAPHRQVSIRVGTRREQFGQIQEMPDSPVVAMRASSSVDA
jgi:hypothetical protein